MIDDLGALVAERPGPTGRASGRYAIGAWVAVWASAIAIGMGLLTQYGLTPGVAAAAPARWPGSDRLGLAPDVPTLVMVVHPRCSCSRASLSELAVLTTRLRDRIRAFVLFVPPGGDGTLGDEDGLLGRAREIEGVTVVVDDGGRQAARLGAATSGQAYLYAPAGELLFAGGVTPMRGHEGDSLGRRSIVEIVESGHAERVRSDVYGCALSDPEQGER